eukprot:gene1600-1163_t
MLLGWYGYLSLISLLLWDTFQSVQLYDEKLDEPDLHRALSTSLPQRCIETDIDEFRTNFAVCFLKGVVLNQFSATDSVLPIESNFWRFESIHGDSITEQIYTPKVPDLLNPSELKSFADEGVLFGDSRLTKDSVEYHDELLILAIDLGHRLMPAFNTKTGIPYGTVNLRHGVPKGETKVSSTAGAGSLFIEFHVLSILTDDDRYGYAAFKALKSLYDRRSGLHLVGKHINIDSGQWQETMSGVGSNSDSFFEYHLKAYAMLHGARPLYHYYDQLYQAVKKYILPDDAWFREVEMFTGRFSRHRIENLDAFWPGLEVAMGHSVSSARQLQALYSVWLDLGFLPEELELAQWKSGKGPSNALYPLRPELIEATVYHYQATKDRSWLAAGQLILESIQNFTRTGCGYASLSNIQSMELTDEMPSFFLSETVKYLYLLFDEDHFLHRRSVIYSTEAHPFDLVQLRTIERERAQGRRGGSVYRGDVLPHEEHFLVQPRDDDRNGGGGGGRSGGGGAVEEIRKGSERPRALKGRRLLQLRDTTKKNVAEWIKQLPAPASVDEEKPLKTVELALGNVGSFDVQVFADAFRITHRQGQVTLDVANGTHTSCHVELIQRDPAQSVQSDPDVLLRLPCALSSFSRNRPHVVEADLSLPSTEYDHFLCRKAVRVRDPAGGTATASRSRGSGRIAPTATRTALDDIAALRDWFHADAEERGGSSVKVRIVIEEQSSLLLSPLFGDRSFPKVWMSKQTIFAQASDRWGTFFQAKDIPATPAGKKGEPSEPPRQDWQMFLVDLKDTRVQKLLPVLTLKTPQGHKLSTDATSLMVSMGQMYRHHIRRTCPADLITVNPRNRKDVRVHPRRVPTGTM